MKRQLCAILAADIVGYSRLMEQDEAGTLARQRVHFLSTIKPRIQEFDGRIVKLMGDGILVEFASVVDAVGYAVSVQRTMHALETDVAPDRRIDYRIGINLGDVFYEDGDIFGDGVNIAARLEQMADPGGVCVSGTAFDHLKSNIAVEYEPLGEVKVKNIQQPVRAYRVILDKTAGQPPRTRKRATLAVLLAVCVMLAGFGLWWASGHPQNAPETASATQDTPADGAALPPLDAWDDKPSIAVLPFDNMNAGADQDYFSDGMTEDLITDLSQVSGLFVLARNTTFVYKDQAVNVQQVGRELGVGYVLEGSVRRAGDRVRINAQLIDVTTGGHVWAQRYDRDLTDVFALQDDVVRRIVAALSVTLNADEAARLSQADKIDPVAYDALLHGLESLRRFTPATIIQAREYFEQAIDIEPGFGHAHADLALTHALDAEMQWSADPAESARKGLEIGLWALELDPDNAPVQFALSMVYRALGQQEKSVAASQRSIELDPNYADGYATLAIALNYAGRPQQGLIAIQRATRLNPLKPFFYVHAEGQSQYLLGNFDDAARLFEQVIASNPEFSESQKMLVATYVELGRLEDAKWSVSELLTVVPNFTIASEIKSASYADPDVSKRYIDNLIKAGLE